MITLTDPSGDPRRARRVTLLTAALVTLACAAPLRAQDARGRNELFTGGELERYLRLEQLLGAGPTYVWSVRGFSPREVDRQALDSAHVWAARYALSRSDDRALGLRLVAPQAELRANSAFPYGSNDAAVWAGRGLTASVSGGATYRRGVFSAAVVPIAFVAQNAHVDLRANGQTGRLAYASADFPLNVDRPQVFGAGRYSQLDPGQSYARVDAGPVALGVSTANEAWGPATTYPFLLGNNAAGFPHIFVGSAHPLNLGIVQLHGRVIYGLLEQSGFAVLTGDSARRLGSGIVGTMTIRGVPGLEVGGARFFHGLWPAGGPSAADLRRPFEGLLAGQATGERGVGADNQLLSVFFRWATAHEGFEVYGEYGRDDHNYDRREFYGEPDHASSGMLGAQKAWRGASGAMTVVRAEAIDFRAPAVGINRGEGAIYTHTIAQQGHTQRGQLLGADVGVGSAAGSVVALDRYDAHGRWTLSWTRDLRGSTGAYAASGTVAARGIDVQHALGADVLRFTRWGDVHAGLSGVLYLNRDYVADRFDVNAIIGLRRPIR